MNAKFTSGTRAVKTGAVTVQGSIWAAAYLHLKQGNSGRCNFFFPKSYFQQTAPKTCFVLFLLSFFFFLYFSLQTLGPISFINFSPRDLKILK